MGLLLVIGSLLKKDGTADLATLPPHDSMSSLQFVHGEMQPSGFPFNAHLLWKEVNVKEKCISNPFMTYLPFVKVIQINDTLVSHHVTGEK